MVYVNDVHSTVLGQCLGKCGFRVKIRKVASAGVAKNKKKNKKAYAIMLKYMCLDNKTTD